MIETINMTAILCLDKDEVIAGHDLALDSWLSQSDGKTVDEAAKNLTAELMATATTEGALTQAANIYGAVKLLIQFAGLPPVEEKARAPDTKGALA